MLAIIYFALMVWIGDTICRRFQRFVSVPHRLAAAFLIGLLTSSWLTYLAARLFAGATRPLLWGNLTLFALAIALFAFTGRKEAIAPSGDADSPSSLDENSRTPAEVNVESTTERDGLEIADPKPRPQEKHSTTINEDIYLPRPAGSNRIDWLFIGTYFILACWLMFATLNYSGGRLQIGSNQYSDFGPNTAIMQSFAVGHNFPTEYPHFAGDRIRYHFLFYFQAGNLEFLGLDPAWSLNLLSILSLVAMLILVMVLGEVLFDSRVVGRLGSALFLFFGSLSYIPYLRKQGSLGAAIQAIANQREFLPSIFPYRGEEWGVWSLVVFLNQRHLAFAIAVVLLVLIFLVLQYHAALSERAAARGSSANEPETTKPAESMDQTSEERSGPKKKSLANGRLKSLISAYGEFIFCGAVLGLLPMWNSAVFVAAAAVLAALFILFPLRKQMLALAITAGVIALPQVIYLSTGSGRAPSPALLHWGYTLDHPTIWNIIKYLGFIFGFKWLVIAVALAFATSLQRRFFIAISTLLLVAFLLQMSVEVLANHKFLHIWLIGANLFAACGLWRLWHLGLRGTTIPGKVAAIALLALITVGGIIDLVPIHNEYWAEVSYKNDRLVDWLTKETDPRTIFLTDRFVNHPILMAGRRIFYGWPYYAWSAGYRASDRDDIYRRMWQERNPLALLQLLHDNNISYVVVDDGVRHGAFGNNLNEQVYRKYFPQVFQDGGLVIFKVPQTISGAPTAEITKVEAAPAVSMFVGGNGAGNGQFNWPRGIAVDDKGNILVADTNNGRIQKFSPDGVFISTFGKIGAGEGEFREPVAIAIDRRGNIYVADFLNHRVQKLKADGTFISQINGPAENFVPRDLAIGADNTLYVADEGGARIVKFDGNGKVTGTFGSRGPGDGQFDQLTSVAVDDKNKRVLVADPRNRRIVVFDTNGKFVANWFVDKFQAIENGWYLHDLVVDDKTDRLYATSTQTDEVLVFDLAGNKLAALQPALPDKLEGASSLALSEGKLYVVDTFAARLSRIDLPAATPSNKQASPK